MIRKANPKDLVKIINLEKEVLDSSLGLLFYLDELNNEFSKVWILERQGEMIGFLSYRNVDQKVEILNLCITPLYQRQGFGKLLLQHLFDNEDFVSVILEVKSTNFPAISLYETFGFGLLTTKKAYYNGIDALVYYYEMK